MSSSREGALLRGAAAIAATSWAAGPSAPGTAAVAREAGSSGAGFRLGDVYAAELTRLRQQAHAEGWAAGHEEGVRAAAAVVAEAERAAATRLAEAQARWDRRLASATTAAAASRPSAWPAA